MSLEIIKSQIYSGMWIPLQYEVKMKIVELFKIPRNGATHVVDGQVQSDGYLDRDLAVLNVLNLQKVLDTDETNLFVLWNDLIAMIETQLTPAIEEIQEQKPNVEMDIKIDGQIINLTGTSKPRGRPKKTI